MKDNKIKIADDILNLFYKEIEDLEYGKVTLACIIRGEDHIHFEIDKHLTIVNEQKNITIKNESIK